jgi:hypothetical protein
MSDEWVLSDEDFNFYSDYHKDAYGFRPRGCFPETKEQFDTEIKQMERTIVQQIAQDKLYAENQANHFEELVTATIAAGAKDRETALRWIIQTEKFYHQQDVEHFVYNKGFLFSERGAALVKELEAIVEYKDIAD